MSATYTPLAMFGIRRESYEEAILELVEKEYLTPEQGRRHIDEGELQESKGILTYCSYSCWETESGGILGLVTKPSGLLRDPEYWQKACKEVEQLLGSDCEMHHFVQIT